MNHVSSFKHFSKTEGPGKYSICGFLDYLLYLFIGLVSYFKWVVDTNDTKESI